MRDSFWTPTVNWFFFFYANDLDRNSKSEQMFLGEIVISRLNLDHF